MKQEFLIGETFGLVGQVPNNLTIEGNTESSDLVPSIDPDYKFRLDFVRDMVGFWYSGEIAMLLIGHAGCGKTSGVEQWHARLNEALLVVVAHPRMEIADLIGHYVPNEKGGLVFHYGPVARAAKEGLSVLIDEYFVLDPGVATGLNALLQGGMLMIPETGEVIRPKNGFRIFAATNPADVGAGYNGRNTQDAANQDRFWVIRMGYPSAEEEVPLVQKILAADNDPAVARQIAERMVDVANRVRKQFCGESDAAEALDITLSTRSLKRWAALMCIFAGMEKSEHYALERAVTNRCSRETAKAIHDMVDLAFGT